MNNIKTGIDTLSPIAAIYMIKMGKEYE